MKKIFSLNMICYLRCNGYKELSVGFNENTKKVYYVFDDSTEVQDAIDKYKEKDTMVNLHGFITEFRELKEELYQHSKKFNK